ncbi:hypothetical protein Anapl_09977 [Anas platyrhynchos]|uniref:Uncharacterized protein n=1 Tax=Anas platyrhynchos TaxID=8839 RepID=R0L3K8_ANAPL|nr:hypothetical protein Anapl_09977 [Anas platyrhynchos]
MGNQPQVHDSKNDTQEVPKYLVAAVEYWRCSAAEIKARSAVPVLFLIAGHCLCPTIAAGCCNTPAQKSPRICEVMELPRAFVSKGTRCLDSALRGTCSANHFIQSITKYSSKKLSAASASYLNTRGTNYQSHAQPHTTQNLTQMLGSSLGNRCLSKGQPKSLLQAMLQQRRLTDCSDPVLSIHSMRPSPSSTTGTKYSQHETQPSTTGPM